MELPQLEARAGPDMPASAAVVPAARSAAAAADPVSLVLPQGAVVPASAVLLEAVQQYRNERQLLREAADELATAWRQLVASGGVDGGMG